MIDNEDFCEDNLMDEDPAFDYLLYKNMTEDQPMESQPERKQNGGCLGALVLIIFPVASSAFGLFMIW